MCIRDRGEIVQKRGAFYTFGDTISFLFSSFLNSAAWSRTIYGWFGSQSIFGSAYWLRQRRKFVPSSTIYLSLIHI